jgi:hypothetical protein
MRSEKKLCGDISLCRRVGVVARLVGGEFFQEKKFDARAFWKGNLLTTFMQR